jgi:uncharacterized protein YndB with AHSA1/START domain
MVKTFAIIGILAVVAIAAVLALAATKPDTFRVQRAMRINAPPEKIFTLINDFHRFATWSPWEKIDPAMKRTYAGSAYGKGAVYAWDSSGKAGVGRMEIADTSPPSRVTIKLDFDKPFATHNIVEFTLVPEGDATNVTWVMSGALPYLAKIVHVFLNMDSMVGKDFETGLGNLKTLTET